jgi:glycosyltransferase involved in cell wall biosynthesis
MLTVLFATRNRAQILREVLDAFCQLQAPPTGWKLIVVDNGSTDGTPQVLASFANRLPLTFLFEPRLGKNFALNTGLDSSQGDLIVFTDDDVFPNPDWLIRLREAADAQPTYSIFGGPILPRWEVPPPRWIRTLDLAPIFAITPTDLQAGELPPHRATQVFGPNMAILASVFASGMRFDTSIGPQGESYAMGSETELVLRLARKGHKGWHVPDAVVEHFIRKEQLETSWVMRRAIRMGRGYRRLHGAPRLWWGLPRTVYRSFPREGLVIAVAWAIRASDILARARVRFHFSLGIAIESRLMAQERSPQARSASKVATKNP